MSSTDGSGLPRIQSHPYVAGLARARLIRERHGEVRRGMTPAQLTAVLGEPDEVRPLFAPRKYRPDRIGCTWWYVIQRLEAGDSVQDRRELAVRVSFGLDERVTAVDSAVDAPERQ